MPQHNAGKEASHMIVIYSIAQSRVTQRTQTYDEVLYKKRIEGEFLKKPSCGYEEFSFYHRYVYLLPTSKLRASSGRTVSPSPVCSDRTSTLSPRYKSTGRHLLVISLVLAPLAIGPRLCTYSC